MVSSLILDWDNESEHTQIIEHSLESRGLERDESTIWIIYGPHEHMDYRVYVGEVFDATQVNDQPFDVAIYPWGVYRIEYPSRWWETTRRNRFCL